MPHFDTDWFSYAIPNFQGIKQYLQPVTKVLEIGVYQGRSSCWILENMLSEHGTLTCIDPFIDSDQHSKFFSSAALPQGSEREQLFRSNTAEVKKPTQTLQVHVGRSFYVLADLLHDREQYDFIYCDGNHSSASVMADAVMCFGLLRPGGILLFDDYLWDHVPDHHERPKMSIDAFVNMFANHARPIITNYQLAIQRL